MSYRWTTTGRRWRTSPAQEEEVQGEEKEKLRRRNSRKFLKVGHSDIDDQLLLRLIVYMSVLFLI